VVAAAALVFGTAIAVVPAGGDWPALQGTSASSASSRPPPSTAPTAITDLPADETARPDALSAYRAGLQAMRDASWQAALERLHEAVGIDPGFALAHLRLAQVHHDLGESATEARASLQRALQLRSKLSDRDRVLLDIVEAVVAREPPDHELYAARIEAALGAYPADAELCILSATVPGRSADEVLRLASRALELDPRAADGWQLKSRAYFALGQRQEGMDALAQCLEVSPTSNDCLRQRALARSADGDCAGAEIDVRHWMAASPTSARPYDILAALRAHAGDSAESIRTLLEQRAARLDPDVRTARDLTAQAYHHFHRGEFHRALAAAREAETAVRSAPDQEAHLRPAVLLTTAYAEMGQPALAARTAHAYLDQMGAWSRPLQPVAALDGFARLIVAAHGRKDASYAELWDRLQGAQRTLGPVPGSVVALASAVLVRDATDAAAWRASLGAFGIEMESLRPAAWLALVDGDGTVSLSGPVGYALRLAGDENRGRLLLSRARAECHGALGLGRDVSAALHLGEALAQQGDKDGAAALFREVVQRWGKAPESVTAQAARAALQRLSPQPLERDRVKP
jgi:tetratricopeptide (TPR) repeat protein